MIKQIYKAIKETYKAVNDNTYDNVYTNLVRYFRTEYGKDWEQALSHHLDNKNFKNDKKAA